MPRKNVARMKPIQIKVIPAFLLRGSLKAVMPLEMASMPVSAAVPLEKACRIRNGVIKDTVLAISSSGGSTTVPNVPLKKRNNPKTQGDVHHQDKEIIRQSKEQPQIHAHRAD